MFIFPWLFVNGTEPLCLSFFLQFISKNYFWLFIVEQLYQFLQVDARKGENLLLNHRFLALIFAVFATDFRIGLVALLFADVFYIECLFSVELGMIMNTEFRIWDLSPLWGSTSQRIFEGTEKTRRRLSRPGGLRNGHRTQDLPFSN